MIIIKLTGGLGNQMFQYAFGRSLSVGSNLNIKYDISWYTNRDQLSFEKETPRKYTLDKFNTRVCVASAEELILLNPFWKKIIRKISKKVRMNVSSNEQRARDGAYLEGAWTSEKHFIGFKDIIRNDFTLKNTPSKETIASKNLIRSSSPSVSVHIRRGDYVTDQKTKMYHGQCDMSYYEKAIETISSRIKVNVHDLNVFVFSDDIEWSKINMKLPARLNFVSNMEIPDYEEIYLMSLCDHHIIANSTFSWWGAWLNPKHDKIVVAPKRWSIKQSHLYGDVVPPEWLKI